jgi:hypothetical protein
MLCEALWNALSAPLWWSANDGLGMRTWTFLSFLLTVMASCSLFDEVKIEDYPGTYFRANHQPPGSEVLELFAFANGTATYTFAPSVGNALIRTTGSWQDAKASPDKSFDGRINFHDLDLVQLRPAPQRISIMAELRKDGKIKKICLGPPKFDLTVKCYVRHVGMYKA